MNMTQQDLAQKLEMSPTTIGKYETGVNEPNIDTLKKLSQIFGVSIDSLVGNDNAKFLDLRLLTDDCANLIREIANMPDIKIQKIQGYIEGLRDK